MQTINSKELLRDCYGLGRQQKKGSCWLDSTLEIFLNADTIGELVRSEMFEYGMYMDKKIPIPYKVNKNIIKENDYQSFLIYIIFNFILFNLEITSISDFITIVDDKVKIHRQDSFNRCEKSLETFMSIIEHILYKENNMSTVINIIDTQMKDKPDTKLSPGGHIIQLSDILFNYIPNINLYIDKKVYKSPAMFDPSIRLFNRDIFIGASISFKIINIDRNHATSIIKCSDKIFYYDNNAPINIKTKKRNIDLSEHIINKSGKKTKTGLDDFWQTGLGYIKHYCDYFTDPGHFIYKERITKKASDLLKKIIIFNKKSDYNKIINVIDIKGESLKKILSDNFLESVNDIINTKFNEEYKGVLTKISMQFCTYLNIPFQDKITRLESSNAYYKYLKYKGKYLALVTLNKKM